LKIVIEYRSVPDPQVMPKLKALGEVVTLKDRKDETVIQELRDADAFTYLGASTPVTRKMMEAAPKLKIVARGGVGTDGIDKVAATELGIVVTNGPGVSANAVAENAVALAFALSRNVALVDRAMREGRGWKINVDPVVRERHMEIRGKTWGVIGHGMIGSLAAAKANGLGCTVVYNKRHRLTPEQEKKQNIKYLSFEELLRVSDIISMHLPLNSETEGIINKNTLKLVKPTAMFINQSRGKVVNDPDMVEWLKANPLAGYGTDVWEQEPPPDNHPLFKLDNAVCTPHQGGGTRDNRLASSMLVYENVANVLNGKDPVTPVNTEVLKSPKLRYKAKR
jgi:phosphoglycerate dehydrogenase-like enzyme